MPGIVDPRGPPKGSSTPSTLTSRLLWFVALAGAGIAVTAVVAFGLRALLEF